VIRVANPGEIGQALGQVRKMLGISRRQAARQIAAAVGRSETSVNSQLWGWDHGKHQPDLTSIPVLLDVIDFDLALVERPEGPRTWPRLEYPPADVLKVRGADGTVWTRMDDEGRYWNARGWDDGVSWSQVLLWGPVAEVQ